MFWVTLVLFAGQVEPFNLLSTSILGRELTQKYIQVLNTVVFQTLYLGYKSLGLDSLVCYIIYCIIRVCQYT